MSHVQLQVKPRRTRCSASYEPPPFRFDALQGPRAKAAAGRGPALVRAPARALAILFGLVGRIVDAAFFVAGLTVWCAIHLVLWSYAFEVGPAANCFGLPCPSWVAARVLVGCLALAVMTFLIASILRRLGHRATANVLLLLVTLDVAAIMLLVGHQLF